MLVRIALCLSLLAVLARAHICILDPPQRGPLSITTPGDPSCYRRTDYCGGVPLGNPSKTYIAGQEVVMTFQQNLNHYYQPNPGYFDVGVSYSTSPDQSDWMTLASLPDWPAHDMVTQTNLTVRFQLPPKACNHCILRLRYHSNNPDEVHPPKVPTPIFYQCSDIRILPSDNDVATAFEPHVPQQLPRRADPSDCVTPPQWTANAMESTELGVSYHQIWWDASSKLTRWDREGPLETRTESALSLITNYTRPLREYVYQPTEMSCAVYGPNEMYPWAFGSVLGMEFQGNQTVGTSVYSTWTLGDSFTFTAERLSSGYCRPVQRRVGSSVLTFLTFQPGWFDPSVFNPNPACQHQSVRRCTE